MHRTGKSKDTEGLSRCVLGLVQDVIRGPGEGIARVSLRDSGYFSVSSTGQWSLPRMSVWILASWMEGCRRWEVTK